MNIQAVFSPIFFLLHFSIFVSPVAIIRKTNKEQSRQCKIPLMIYAEKFCLGKTTVENYTYKL